MYKHAGQGFTQSCFSKGFTLIELLVAVLIIGILAAIAVPQYQKAVTKSKATQILTSVKNLANAQEIYYLNNYSYATDFGKLDIDFNSLSSRSISILGTYVTSTDAVRYNEIFELVISPHTRITFSTGTFLKGKYKGCGFMITHGNNAYLKPNLYCHESIVTQKTPGVFCTELFNGTLVYTDTGWGTRFYKLP